MNHGGNTCVGVHNVVYGLDLPLCSAKMIMVIDDADFGLKTHLVVINKARNMCS